MREQTTGIMTKKEKVKKSFLFLQVLDIPEKCHALIKAQKEMKIT